MISNAHYHNFDEMVLDCTSIRSRFEISIEFDLQTSRSALISPPLECLLSSVGNVDDSDNVDGDEEEDVHGGEDLYIIGRFCVSVCL